MRKYFTIKEKSTNELIALLGQDSSREILKDTEHFYYTQITNSEFMSFYRYCLKNNIFEFCAFTVKTGTLLGMNVDKSKFRKLFQYKYELDELLEKNSKNAQK